MMDVKILHCIILSLLASVGYAANNYAPVAGFARSFILQMPIKNASITVLETGQSLRTDDNGKFGPFLYPVGKPITLILKKFPYPQTQSATIIVPKQGLTTPYNNITFQVPSIFAYYALATIMGAKIDDQSCHVATTVTAYHKTLDDEPQGEAGATITLTPAVDVKPFYFDLFTTGFLINKTNPFTKDLTSTSLDGGVAFFNLPPSDKPYTLSAVKPGVKFTKVHFICRKGEFINLSPPQGPSVIP